MSDVVDDFDRGHADAERVRAYYERKTRSILEKYGPGPRVHFHTGLVEEARPMPGDPASISTLMVRAQEAMLEHVRDGSPAPIVGRVLDIGCGLGGGSLFFAAEPGIERVTAITIEPTHVELVERFAAAAGLADRVDARLLDAHDVSVLAGLDHALAIESSCYLRREPWARQTHAALKRGGLLHIVDCFRAPGAALGWFDRYWRTKVGTVSEYSAALERAGFEIVCVEDLAQKAVPFWDLSCAWITLSEPDVAVRSDKIEAHRALQRALRSGSLRYLRLVARAR